MLGCIRDGEDAPFDFEVRRRRLVPKPARRLDRQAGSAGPERFVQLALDRQPLLALQRSAWAEHVGWGYRIVVAVVPALHQPPIGRLVNQAIEDRRKLVSRDARGDGTPAVPVSQEDEEVRPAGLTLAAGDLLEADLHCALVASRLLAHTPTQIDRLETCPSLQAELREFGKHPRVERLALHLQILEGRTHEEPEEPSHGSPHRSWEHPV